MKTIKISTSGQATSYTAEYTVYAEKGGLTFGEWSSDDWNDQLAEVGAAVGDSVIWHEAAGSCLLGSGYDVVVES